MKSVTGKSFIILLFFIALSACNKKMSGQVGITDSIPTHPLTSERDLNVLMQQIGNARIVLLGEASHGTSEYYNWRAALTKRLMQEKGFKAMAVEGEWADSYRVNRFIKGPRQDSVAAVNVLKNYDRWPTWMWGNYEVASLVTWMNGFNQTKPNAEKVGFYGLDVYCLWESTQELRPYLQNADTAVTNAANKVENCFRPFSADPQLYVYAVANTTANCSNQTGALWNSITNLTGDTTATNEPHFVMQQNSLVALNGEKYYRAAGSDYSGSWNIRDRHMSATLNRLLKFLGPDSKIIVWEHNTHVGDARYTDMAAEGMVNLGQLARQDFGPENVFAIGFGSYKGSVIAADSWGSPYKKMNVPAAPAGSWEGYLHSLGASDKIVISKEIAGSEGLQKAIGNRAIGVVYNPYNEAGNYVPSIIPSRYDAFVFIDHTSALHPIPIQQRNEPPDTYPSGY